ncbi:MAG: NYN domain-containing protein [Chlorobiaceae bacterium]|nr:NYN domain-containing protein [Chlorobiaceae bacterium]
MNRVAIFIDGANLYYTQRHLGWSVDFQKLLKYFSDQYKIVQARYYVASPEPPSDEQKAFNRFLISTGYSIKSKLLKKITIKESGETVLKGNLDIELVIDALVSSDQYDIFILFSGDGDFLPLIEAIKSKGKNVFVYSTIGLSSIEIVSELGMNFCDLNKMRSIIEQIKPKQKDTLIKSAQIAATDGTSNVIKNSLPNIGDIFVGQVQSVKNYGIFLVNPFNSKCLLPIGQLGVTKYVTDLTSIINQSDLFEVEVYNIDTTNIVPEITVKLVDRSKSIEITSRII